MVAIAGGAGMFPSLALAKPAGFCVECHSTAFLRNPATVPDRSVYQAKLDPCPGMKALAEEMYFNESRVVKVQEILRTLARDGWSTEPLEKKAGRAAEALSQLKKERPRSIREIARESSVLRSGLQKVYDQAVRSREESTRRWLVGMGILCFIAVWVLLGVGFHKLARMGKMALFLLISGGTLFLGACSFEPIAPVKKSPAQESLERSLSVAGQAAGKIEEGLHRSILLARMAREWSLIDPWAGEKAFHLAWRMALAHREEGERLRSFQEMVERCPDRAAALRQKVDYDAVLDLRDEMRNMGSRVWALRAVAEEWIRTNGEEGRQALEFASQKAGEIGDSEIRDRELKSLAEAWVPYDLSRGWEISNSMADPFLKSLSLARLALASGNPDKAGTLLREAWKTASTVSSPYARAQAQARVSASAAKIFPQDKVFWAEQAMTHIRNMSNPKLRESAFLEMVFLWASADGEMAERWAGEIGAEEAEARAYAFLYLSQRSGISREKARVLLSRAVEEAKRIQDGYESQKIMSRAGKEFVRLDPQSALFVVGGIEDPYFRSELLTRMAESLSTKNPRRAMDLAGKIPLEEIRAGAMVELIGREGARARQIIVSLYQETFQAVQAIPDPFTRALVLMELGKEWGGMEKGKEIAPLEMALKSTEGIPNVSARAEILEMLAVSWKAFHPHAAEVILSRVDPSVTEVKKKLGEIRLWAKANPTQARRWAESIPDSFPYEKALAFKEVALNWKKSRPNSALEVLEKALRLASLIQEGVKKNRLVTELTVEAASLNKDWTLRWISQVADRSLRDLLYQGAGGYWAVEDPAQAMKAAGEISESSLRIPLYHKAAESATRRRGQEKKKDSLLSALASWGAGREKAKREELQAVSFYEKALEEMGKLKDPREKVYLLCGLAADWAAIDEKKGMQIAEKIAAGEYPEPYSHALLQIAGRYAKWSRKEGNTLFPRVLAAAEKIGDHSLRAERFFQIAQRWKPINPEKALEILEKAWVEVVKGGGPGGESILAAILQTQAVWEPGNTAGIARKAGSAFLQSKILLEGSKVLRTQLIDEKARILEKAFLLARREKNDRLMGEVAAAWFSIAPRKGLEILGQVEAPGFRVNALRRMADSREGLPPEEVRRLLDQASEEAAKIGDPREKIQLLKEIASDMARIDKERAKAMYREAYQIAEREFLTAPRL